jgi:oxygen-independent coproporphyrinogen-3 oxidase
MTAGDNEFRPIIARHSDAMPYEALSGDAQLPPMDASRYCEALRRERLDDDAERLSVTVHLPFCASRCLTCDHHSNVTHDSREIDRYLAYVDREMQLVTQQLGRRPALQQLHLTGGTPNYLSDTQLARLVEIIDRYFVLDAETEASLDANAHRASRAQLSLLHGLGFRLLNLEIHDFDSEVLKAVGRAQSLGVVADVVENARAVGFTSVAAEMRYGLPQQTATSVRATLRQLLSVQPDRVSCYPHSRRQDSFEHQRAVDAGQLPSLADKVAMFSRIVDTLCGNDYEWIGLDYFARQDDSLAVAQRSGRLQRNAIGYTTRRGRQVLGFGTSSLTDLSSIRVRNHPKLDQWRSMLDRDELPVAAGETVTPWQRQRCNALSSLVCNLKSRSASRLFGEGCDPAMRALLDDGLVEVHADQVSLTESGRFALRRLYGDAATDPLWWDRVA